MQGRDPARTGHAPDQTAPTANPVVRWQATLPDNHVSWSWLIGSANTIYAATNNTIHAFNASTGERDWQTDRFTTLPWTNHRGTLETSPALNGKHLLLGASTSVYALDRTDGNTTWAYKTNSSIDATLHAGNTVYVSSLVGSDDRLVAVDTRSGIERWRTPPGSGVHPHAYSEGYVVGPLIGREAAFGAVDAATGGTEWTQNLQLNRVVRGGSCIVDGTVYCGTGPLYALDLTDGTTQWSASLGTASAEIQPVSDGSKIYLALGETGRVLALDADTGDTAWSIEISGVVDGNGPALADETLYVGLERGVVALDAATGEEQFRVRKSETATLTNSPIIAGGTLYVLLDQTLYAFGEP